MTCLLLLACMGAAAGVGADGGCIGRDARTRRHGG
ncbi:MAG: hypothetical protein C5S47_00335 [Candidatus Methanogasteraceae archaeon]|nr:MAG: hypothetical protein C5S47_00335 [ANME-2 cluster archaeon]